jgi:hypothetical protein
MRRGGGGSRAVRIVAWSLGVLVVLLVVAQLVGPRIAASTISSRIGKYGKVDSVHVSAWPAVELLWRHADSVTVHATRLRVTPAQTGKLLQEAAGTDRVEVHADSVREGPLALSDVSFHKRGSRMSAQARVSTADVAAALPPGFGVQLLGSGGGKVEVRASGGLFGVGASVDAVAEASGGKLVVHPRGLLIEGFKLTLFSDPHVYVTGVSAAPAGGSASGGEGSAGSASGVPAGYRLGMEATLR